MNSDLIERLKQVSLESCDSENAWIGKVADEAIAALSPVLPDEVKESVNYLREYRKDEWTQKAADLIERQQRHLIYAETKDKLAAKKIQKLQQRIGFIVQHFGQGSA